MGFKVYTCYCGASYLGTTDSMPFNRCIYCGRKVALKKRKKQK